MINILNVFRPKGKEIRLSYYVHGIVDVSDLIDLSRYKDECMSEIND